MQMNFDGMRMQVATQDQTEECFRLYHPSAFLQSYGIHTETPFGLGDGIFVPFDGVYSHEFENTRSVAHIDFPVLTGDGGTDFYGVYSVWLDKDGKGMAVSYRGSTPPLDNRNAPRLFDQRMSAEVWVEDDKAKSYNEKGFFNFMFPGFGNDSVEFVETVKRRTG